MCAVGSRLQESFIAMEPYRSAAVKTLTGRGGRQQSLLSVSFIQSDIPIPYSMPVSSYVIPIIYG